MCYEFLRKIFVSIQSLVNTWAQSNNILWSGFSVYFMSLTSMHTTRANTLSSPVFGKG